MRLPRRILAFTAATAAISALLVPTANAATPSPPASKLVRTVPYLVDADHPLHKVGSKLPLDLLAPGPADPITFAEIQKKLDRSPRKTYVVDAGKLPASGKSRSDVPPVTSTDACRATLGQKEGEDVTRFSYCNTKHWALSFVFPPDTEVVGTVEWMQTTAAVAPSDDRNIHLETALQDWKFQGKYSKDDTIDVVVKAPGGAPPNPNPDCAVTPDGRNGVHSLAEWEAQTRTLRAYHVVGQDSSLGLGRDKVSLCAFATYDRVNGGAENAPRGSTTEAIAYNSVRFDSAAYVESKIGRGVIGYKSALPVLQFSKAQPAHAAVAAHIWKAQYYPAFTVPKKVNKSIPGAPRSGKPLTRLYPEYDGPGGEAEREYKLNRKITKDECEKINRPTDYQCDEYPMASTWQGSGFGDGNYSLEMVPATANQSAGGSLAHFYSSQRILHNEEFYVFTN